VDTVPPRRLLNPIHAILLGFPVALFSAALISDIAYRQTAQIQWSNFSSWLIAGALFVGAFVVLWAIIDLFRVPAPLRRGAPLTYLIVLVVMWVLGLINAFLHARDAWYSVTVVALVLSIITALLALAAAWIGYSSPLRREQP
jgi:uncharacterized membrane protein